MASISVLATLYYPSLNPVGGASVFALVVAVALWLIYRTDSRVAFVVALCAPLPLAFYMMGTTRLPDLSDILAAWLLVAFGFALSLSATRTRRGWKRTVGGVWLGVYAILFVLFLVTP